LAPEPDYHLAMRFRIGVITAFYLPLEP